MLHPFVPNTPALRQRRSNWHIRTSFFTTIFLQPSAGILSTRTPMQSPRVATVTAGLFLLLPLLLTPVDAFANDDGTGRPPNGRLLYAWGRDNSNQLSQGDFNTDISTLIDRSKSKRCRLLPCHSSPRPPRTGRHALSSPDGYSNGPRGEQAGLRSSQACICRAGARLCVCGRQ